MKISVADWEAEPFSKTVPSLHFTNITSFFQPEVWPTFQLMGEKVSRCYLFKAKPSAFCIYNQPANAVEIDAVKYIMKHNVGSKSAKCFHTPSGLPQVCIRFLINTSGGMLVDIDWLSLPQPVCFLLSGTQALVHPRITISLVSSLEAESKPGMSWDFDSG